MTASQEHAIPATVILASGSPRRQLLLPIVAQVAWTVSPEIDETPQTGESAHALALRLAKDKLDRARAMLGAQADGLAIVSADTVVSLHDQPLGKPSTDAEAQAMLEWLRGGPHTVITGIAVGEAASLETRTTWVTTEVEMRHIEDHEIQRYVARGEPFDKAGGYAIQDPELAPVNATRGCIPNVVGLPLCAVQALLSGYAGEPPFVPAEAPCALCRRASEMLLEHGFRVP